MPFVYLPLWAPKVDLNPVPSGSAVNYWAAADAAAASGVFLQLESYLNSVSASLSATIASGSATSASLSATISGVAVISGNLATVSGVAHFAAVSASAALSSAAVALASASDLSSTIGSWDMTSGTIYTAVSSLSSTFIGQAQYVQSYLNTVAGTGSGWPATGSTYGTGSGGRVISGSMSATLDWAQRSVVALSAAVAAISGATGSISGGGYTPPTASFDIYVDAGFGSDTNSGTIGAPVQTFNRAWDLTGLANKGVRIFFASGTYDVVGQSSSGTKLFWEIPSQWGAAGQGVGLIGGYDILYSGTVSSRTLDSTDVDSIIDPQVTASYAVDALVGKYILFTTGPASGSMATIWSNDSTGKLGLLYPVQVGQPAVGNAYRILQPNVKIRFSGTHNFVGAGPLTFRGVNLSASSTSSSVVNFYAGAMVYAQATHFTNLNLYFFNGTTFTKAGTATNDVFLPTSGLGAIPFFTASTLTMWQDCRLNTTPFFKGGSLQAVNADLEFTGGHFTGSYIYAYRGGTLHNTPPFSSAANWLRVWGAPGDAITVESHNTANFRRMDIRNAGGHAIKAAYNCNMSLFDITGSGNTGAGIYAGPGALLDVYGTLQISGTAGEIVTAGGLTSSCAAVLAKTGVLDPDNNAAVVYGGGVGYGSGSYAKLSSSLVQVSGDLYTLSASLTGIGISGVAYLTSAQFTPDGGVFSVTGSVDVSGPIDPSIPGVNVTFPSYYSDWGLGGVIVKTDIPQDESSDLSYVGFGVSGSASAYSRDGFGSFVGLGVDAMGPGGQPASPGAALILAAETGTIIAMHAGVDEMAGPGTGSEITAYGGPLVVNVNDLKINALNSEFVGPITASNVISNGTSIALLGTVLQSPNQIFWRFSVDNSGVLSSTTYIPPPPRRGLFLVDEGWMSFAPASLTQSAPVSYSLDPEGRPYTSVIMQPSRLWAWAGPSNIVLTVVDTNPPTGTNEIFMSASGLPSRTGTDELFVAVSPDVVGLDITVNYMYWSLTEDPPESVALRSITGTYLPNLGTAAVIDIGADAPGSGIFTSSLFVWHASRTLGLSSRPQDPPPLEYGVYYANITEPTVPITGVAVKFGGLEYQGPSANVGYIITYAIYDPTSLIGPPWVPNSSAIGMN